VDAHPVLGLHSKAMPQPVRGDIEMADSGKGHGFFAVDRWTWARVCGLGLNAAVAYLVLARGTGKSNRESAWSVMAIENYTGISRSRAHDALSALMEDCVVRKLREGTRPKYELVPWHLVPGSDPRPPLSSYEQSAVDKALQGKKLYRWDTSTLADAVKKGWLIEDGDGKYSIAPRPDTDPDWTWLPNELVTGAAAETPPIELIRQVQDVMTLRLFIDLYHAQNLREDGGISRKITWEGYERVKVGQQGPYSVWGFDAASTYANCVGPAVCHWRDELTEEEQKAGKNEAVDFFRRLHQLGDLGLIEWVRHLFESDQPDAEIIHAVGIAGSDSLEGRIGFAADEAGRAMLNDQQQQYVDSHGMRLVPVPRHLGNVQMIGIARLRYRPHTKLTTAWWKDLNKKGEKYLAQYEALAKRNE
jgi:hypothetical protein